MVDPIIFRGLKSLTLDDTQQQSLLRLAMEGISVYCPHTAVDAVVGGLGDWLVDIVTGDVCIPRSDDMVRGGGQIASSNKSSAKSKSDKGRYSNPSYPVFADEEGEEPSYNCSVSRFGP